MAKVFETALLDKLEVGKNFKVGMAAIWNRDYGYSSYIEHEYELESKTDTKIIGKKKWENKGFPFYEKIEITPKEVYKRFRFFN